MDQENIEINTGQDDKEQKLKELVEEQIKKVRMAGLLSGSKAICHVILEYIADFEKDPGKKTFRQQTRLINRIKSFCETGTSRKLDDNGNIIPGDLKNDNEEVSEET